jgi:hypothetical protein
MENNHLLRGFDNWETCARYWHQRTSESQTAHILLLKKFNEMQKYCEIDRVNLVEAEMKNKFLEPYKERYESAILEGDLLRTKNEELQERIIECEGDYQDICELAGQLALPIERESLMDAVGRENYERFKNHIGW